MEKVVNVQARQGSGKGVSRKIRAQDRVPAICYGKSFETPVPVSVGKKEIAKVIRESSANTLLKLKSEEKTLGDQMVLIKAKQNHPVTGDIMHVDFQVLNMKEKIKVSIPVELTGKCKGVVEGGILQQPNRKIPLQALPNQIPDKIIADVTNLDLNESLHVSDVKLPEGASVVGSVDYTLAVVVPPENEPTAQEAAKAAAAGQPEVTGQKSEAKADDKKEEKK